jgi:predicted MPP superfamily phosphohydrolase
LAGVGAVGLVYSLCEAKYCRLVPASVTVPNLPDAFSGLRVALVSDVHHGPFVPLWYVRRVVDMVNAAEPDLVCMAGDFVHRSPEYTEPCIEALSALRAPLGCWAVLGNHDHWEGAERVRDALRNFGIGDLSNVGTWLERGDARVRLGGVGDLWEDKQDLNAALGDATDEDASLILAHNPDWVETVSDPRVGLVLSGHTHGGQVVLPFVGPPLVPSRFGQKYVRGLVQTSVTQVYVSRGVGTITPPVRFACPPEVPILTLG